MSFFKQFPLSSIAIGDELKRVVDIFRHVDVNDILADEISSYQYYNILDGERPDNVSQKLYGTPDYYWTFFIINETLKKGLDDWPKSDRTIENEFAQEYDNIGVMTFLPQISDRIREADREYGETPTPADYISNTFNGLDLSYEKLRVTRNFETARIVKWDSNLNQLWLTDFTNKANFMADPAEIATKNRLDRIKITGRYNNGQAIVWRNLDYSQRSQLHFWFDDWQLIGAPPGEKSGRVDAIGSDGRLIAPAGSELAGDYNPFSDPNFRKSTMTKARSEWIEHLFEWHHNRLIESADQMATGSRPIHTPYMQYINSARYEKGLAGGANNISIHERREELLNTFYSYFVPAFTSGRVMFDGFTPLRMPSGEENNGAINQGVEHKWSTAREAPHHYYVGDDGYDHENIVQSWQVLSGTGYERQSTIFAPRQNQDSYTEQLENSDPRKYISNYEWEHNTKLKKTPIRVVRPELIDEFARAYKAKLNEGLSRTSGITVTTPNTAVARAAGTASSLGATGGASYTSGGMVGGGGGAPAPSGGSGY